MIAQIIPCVWITPIDCFWEGSKPLGPFPPINLYELNFNICLSNYRTKNRDIAGSFLPSLPKSALSWKNLNPELLLQDAKSLVNVGMVADLFDRVS
jgi:patched 1 protein